MEQQETLFEEVAQSDVAEQKSEMIDVAQEPPAVMANMDIQTSGIGSADAVFTSLASFKDCYMIGKYFSESNLVPQAYQKKPMDCAIAVDIANRMGVSPMFVMQNLWVVRGVPSWSGQACMGIIKACGRYKNVKYNMIGEKGKDTFGCYVSAIEIATGDEVDGAEVTIGMAKAEGWYGKSGSKWQTMPDIMARYRAATFFARLYCPNELMGFRVEGEAEDIPTQEKREREAIDMFGKGLA